MHKTISVLLVSALFLSACSGWRNSRANPSNWFGSSTTSSPPVEPSEEYALIPDNASGEEFITGNDPDDRSVMIAVVDEMQIDQTPTGAIVYAAGTASRQGAYDARLTRIDNDENVKNGILEFAFRVNYPISPTAQGTPRSRMVSDAITLGRRDLEGVRLIRVVGQQNALESRRR
ncbi:hypothetical protein [Ruegeria arenilitoris]|uniref:hypothetical protein n=1 Tax=Ruegeria arenilitoris TaxID=1173585 RepID=UPI00147EE541|nr:hypothetical protein [Ruegeria arenilitoris]